MIRTQIQLSERQYDLLKRLSRRENVSMAELIRRAVDLFEKERTATSSREIRERAKSVAGRFRSGVHDLSDRHDEHFVESIR